MVGRRIVRLLQHRRDLRLPLPAQFAKKVEGRTVRAIDRRAKYLLFRLDDGNTLIAHLGMSGRMTLHDAASAAEHPFDRHDHVVFETDEGWQVRFNDARRFGLMLLAADSALAKHKLFKGLGPEPLGDDFDGAVLAARLKGRRTPIKAALLDQKTLVGVGNIYACEALFLAGISPRRSSHTIQGERADKLVAAIKKVLQRSIEDGGSTLRDHVQPGGELGYFQTRFNVYDRAGIACPTRGCAKTVRRLVQAGRSTFYCAHCQR
jgi:formamidopyrimidine-DNA glycosylase